MGATLSKSLSRWYLGNCFGPTTPSERTRDAIPFDGGGGREILGDGMRVVPYDRRQHFPSRNYGTGQSGVWQFHD